MTPQEFAAMTRKAAADVGRLTDAGARRAADLLREVQRDLVVRLAAAPTDYGEWFYTELQRDADRLLNDLQGRYAAALEDTLAGAEQVVQQMVDDAGLTLAMPRASWQTVEFLAGYDPGKLIGGLTAAAKQQVQAELRQALMGVKTPWEVQQSLAAKLDAAGPFRTIHARAEAIWTTEANRVFNTLAQERYRRVSDRFPGRFQKQWLHSGNLSHPRPHHQALNGQTIPMEDQFLVSGIPVDGPHDPALPASEVIRCGCTTILVEVDGWQRSEL